MPVTPHRPKVGLGSGSDSIATALARLFLGVEQTQSARKQTPALTPHNSLNRTSPPSRISPARPARVTETTHTRAVVSWNGPGQPIMLTVYGADGEAVALPLEPKRALTLAQELLTRGVSAIKADPTAPWAPE